MVATITDTVTGTVTVVNLMTFEEGMAAMDAHITDSQLTERLETDMVSEGCPN